MSRIGLQFLTLIEVDTEEKLTLVLQMNGSLSYLDQKTDAVIYEFTDAASDVTYKVTMEAVTPSMNPPELKVVN